MDMKLVSATGRMLVSCPHLIGEHGNWQKQKRTHRLLAATLIPDPLVAYFHLLGMEAVCT